MQEDKSLANDLTSILDELDNESLEDLSEEQLLEYRKKLNVYGRTIQGADNYLTFSFTNLSEKYMEKLTLTSMIGYLNRMVDEWHVPEGHPVIPVYDHFKNPELINNYHKEWKLTDKTSSEIADNKEWMKKRLIVKEFLEEMFQYNPDRHIRSAYKPQTKDLSRPLITTPAANLAIENHKLKDSKFKEQMLEFDRVQKLIQMKENATSENDNNISQKLILPSYHYSTVDFSKWSDEDKNALRTACEMIPPSDIFHRYRNYLEANYDKLREAVQYLYCDKPDFDIAINPYDWHASEDEAFEFQKKHKKEVISDIIKAHSGKWNFFAPFAKVRDSMKYFNDNTIVLEEIANQIEKDAKIGEELMKKRVKTKKKQNIKEDGPDAEAFSKWKESNKNVKNANIDSNKESYAPDDCPDNAIAVDVIRLSNDGTKMSKSHFFTQAVAPVAQDEKSNEASSSKPQI